MTTEDLFKKYSNLCTFEESDPEYLIDKEDFKEALIKFTSFHTTRALEEASKRATSNGSYRSADGHIVNRGIDKESILNAYPLENIK